MYLIDTVSVIAYHFINFMILSFIFIYRLETKSGRILPLTYVTKYDMT